MLFFGANLPLGQIVDENSADGDKVFIYIIRVVYCTPKSSFPRMMHHRDMFLDFIECRVALLVLLTGQTGQPSRTPVESNRDVS